MKVYKYKYSSDQNLITCKHLHVSGPVWSSPDMSTKKRSVQAQLVDMICYDLKSIEQNKIVHKTTF